MQHFDKLFESLSEQEKSDYLLKILNKKAKLKNAFIEEFKARFEKIRLEGYAAGNIEELLNEIEEKADELKDELDTLDFEETNWENYRAPSHYVPEWEAAQQVAEDEAMEIFKPYLFELEVALRAGNLTDITKQYLIIFDGAMRCEINDPYSNLSESPEDFFIDQANSLVDSKIKELSKRKFLDNDYLNCFDLAFRFCIENYPDERELIEGFSHLFMPVVNTKETASLENERKILSKSFSGSQISKPYCYVSR